MKICFRCKKNECKRSLCTECRKEYDKAWYLKHRDLLRSKHRRFSKEFRAKRKKFVDDLKNNPCKDCNNKFPSYVMQFDHLKDKKFEISRALTSYSIEEILKEISKCDLVCANCHAIRTFKRNIK
jgi:hypothetical protein